jgi:hypothetical protein
MNQNTLLLERYSGRPPERLHEGQNIIIRPNHFQRAFKQRMSVTPAQWRRVAHSPD